jgi:NADP-dependent 3-hydroxy acid dehydrogenase YdfG
MTRLLVIGGTGMLHDATAHFIRSGLAVTVVARQARLLQALQDDHPDQTVQIVAQDYHDTENFLNALSGSYDHVVCWMHSSAHKTLDALLDRLAKDNPQTVFFHIKGSASYNPATVQNLTQDRMDALDYREIILGFKIEKDHSRWLNHDEIAAGVIAAVQADPTRTLIGVTTPWNARP